MWHWFECFYTNSRWDGFYIISSFYEIYLHHYPLWKLIVLNWMVKVKTCLYFKWEGENEKLQVHYYCTTHAKGFVHYATVSSNWIGKGERMNIDRVRVKLNKNMNRRENIITRLKLERLHLSWVERPSRVLMFVVLPPIWIIN